MKKRIRKLTKVTLFYDRTMFIISIIQFPLVLLLLYPAYRDLDIKDGNIIKNFFVSLYSFEWLRPGFHRGHSAAIIMAILLPFMFLLVLACLRRRRLDKNGVSALYFGIRYKYISWDDLESVKRTRIRRKLVDERFIDDIRDILIFTSKRNSEGNTTVIKMDATSKARALAEKYFGPPEYFKTVSYFDD